MILFVFVLGLLGQSPAGSGEGQAQPAPRDDAMEVLARAQPDTIRIHVQRLFARAAATAPDSVDRYLGEAERLARAYEVAWEDPFLMHRVERFRAWSPAERRVKAEADSLRLAGNAALERLGPDSAMRLWRRSVDLSARLGDSVGVAMGWGNLGGGFFEQGALDSATAYYSRSRDYAERLGDFRTEGNAVLVLAAVSADQGEFRRAEDLYRQAAALRSRSGDDRGSAAAENNRGLIAQTLGDIPAAREAFTRALESNVRAGRRGPAATNLINLGNLAALTGSLDSAGSYYRQALAIYRTERSRVGEAEVLHDLGLLALRDGDYRAAAARLSESLAIYRITGPAIDVVAVQRDLANARAAMGDLQGALRELDRADRASGVGAPGAGPALRAGIMLSRADLSVQFNRLDDASRDYPRAEALYHQAGDPVGQAAARQGQGFLLLMKEDYAQAMEALQVAVRLQGEAGDHRAAALTSLFLAYAQSRNGDSTAAGGTLGSALDSLNAVGDDVGVAAALWGLGDLAARGGKAVAAESLYRQGLSRLQGHPAPGVSWELHVGLAQALNRRGALDPAIAELQAAAGEIELVAGRMAVEPLRISYLADKTEVYSQMARLEHAAGHGDRAFAASERLRAREMLDLLGRGRIAFGATPGDSLAARGQSLRAQIADLTSQLDRSGERDLRERDIATTSAVTREALAQAQDAYTDLLLRLEETDGRAGALLGGRVATVREVMGKLAPDEALLEYLVADSTTLVFAVTADTQVTIDLGVGRHDLAALIDFTRGVLTPSRTRQRDQLWRTPLRRLYQDLIAPVEGAGLLNGKRTLFIVPHAELHYLPFAALIGSGQPEQYLIERYTIEIAPSASVWLRLRERATTDQPEEGVLALAPRVDVLPGSRAEVEAIRQVYGPRTTVLAGIRASEAVLRAEAGHAGIIHLATFGVLNKRNPLFSYVELAPHGEDDGRLEVHEVFGLGLHARLVVLSACQTALGSGALADVPAGDDWVGLVQAFLYAGAGSVMASLWPVEDQATADLMTRFYRELTGGAGEAQALAQAQRLALRHRATAEPFYWAGFTMSGGR